MLFFNLDILKPLFRHTPFYLFCAAVTSELREESLQTAAGKEKLSLRKDRPFPNPVTLTFSCLPGIFFMVLKVNSATLQMYTPYPKILLGQGSKTSCSHYQKHPIPKVLSLSWVARRQRSLPPGPATPWAQGKARELQARW